MPEATPVAAEAGPLHLSSHEAVRLALEANAEIDVLGVNTQSDLRNDRASMRFTAEVTDMTQLSWVIDRLAQIPDVLDVRRQLS